MSNDPSEPDAAAGGPNEGVSHAADPNTWASPAREPSAPTDAEPHGPSGAAQHSADVPHDAGATAELPAPYGRDPQGRPAAGVAGQHGAAPGGWPAPAYGAPAGWPPATRIENSRIPQPDPGAWYGAPAGGRFPEHPAGDPRYPGHGAVGGGFGPPRPAAHFLEPPPRGGRAGAGSRGGLYALGLVAVLLAGLIGGVVGNLLARDDRSGSIGVLGEPLPEVDEAAAPTTPVEAIAARVLPSVVQLRVEGSSSSGEGSAMVLSADGLLLTNNHVVEAAADAGNVTAVFQDGTTAAALIIGRDPSSDLAVLRAQNMSGLIPVELGNSDSVRVGQQVVAFGAPLGLGGTVTTGIISAIDRAVNVGEETGANTPTVLNALQTDAAINPGNSGGPLVDMQGRVVGINSAIATTGAQGGSIGVGFSIPVNQARRVAEELERTGRASRAILGVTVGDDPRQAGAVIRGVTPGGAAEQAGIRIGDVVLRFGDQRISTGTDLQAAVGSRAPGEVVEVQLADRTVLATLGTAPN